jgi:hypothetical protein
VIVISGPKTSSIPQETGIIGAFLDAGGKALLMVESGHRSGRRDDFSSPGTSRSATTRSIDASGVGRLFGTGPGGATGRRIRRSSDYAGYVDGRRPSSRSHARSEQSGWSAERHSRMDRTADDLRGRAGVRRALEGGEARFDEGKDNKGPVTLGVTATKKVGEKESRLVVIGDSDLPTTTMPEWSEMATSF